MHCHDCLKELNLQPTARKIVLAGNPNVGKSVFFGAFTGVYTEVSNFPGTTVDISHGKYGNDVVLDTPGVYGISSFNEEERVARDVILSADVIVNVVDAVHLERDLFLTLQIIDTGIPMVVALNMMDDATNKGIAVDRELLEHLLGVPVIAASAIQNIGVEEVKRAVDHATVGFIEPELKAELERMMAQADTQGDALLILEDDPHVAERHGMVCGGKREAIYAHRRERVNDLVKHVVSERSKGATLSTRLGRWMLSPVLGVPILAVVLGVMYWLIGVFIAQDVVEITEGVIMQGYYEPWIRSLVVPLVGEDTVLGAYLVGEFGLLTMTVTYVLGLLLPLVLGFYFVLSVMEDSGYLPRLATLVDRLMVAIGLNGRAIIPIILGFGCVTMATITTRLMATERERTIVTALLGLAIPCSAQFGVIAALMATLPPIYAGLYVLVMVLVFGLAGKVLHNLLPGAPSDLLIDLPPIRLPQAKNVWTKMTSKSVAFLKEATPIFAFGAVIITTLQVTNLLVAIQEWFAPITEGLLSLPRESANVFIMGMIRRDFGAAGLSDMVLTDSELTVALVVITLFVPCIASILMMMKERGKKEGVAIWLGSWVVAFGIGAVLAHLL